MGDHNANLGSTSSTEKMLMVGDYPHIERSYDLVVGLAEDLELGRIMALSIDGTVYPFGNSYSLDIALGDGAAKDFTGKLGPVEPESVSITDGTETFTDNGDGTLTGDATGTGSVDYTTGFYKVSFNAAPANQAAISATVKNCKKGPLTKMAYTTDGIADVCVHGPVNNNWLHLGTGELSVADRIELDNLGVWPIG